MKNKYLFTLFLLCVTFCFAESFYIDNKMDLKITNIKTTYKNE